MIFLACIYRNIFTKIILSSFTNTTFRLYVYKDKKQEVRFEQTVYNPIYKLIIAC